MYELTESEMAKCDHVLEYWRSQLLKHGEIVAGGFDGDIRQALGIGSSSIKQFLVQLYRRYPRYKYLAAYCMNFGHAAGPCGEFETLLGELYRQKAGSTGHNGKVFWDRFKSPDAMQLRREIDELRGSPDQSKRLDTLRIRLRELTGEEY